VAKANGVSPGDIAVALAAVHGVSTRTLRRQPWWKPVMMGQDA
jgi:hypothetical protein